MAAPQKRTARIVSRWDSDRVLFECDVPDDVVAGMEMRHALEKATAARASLVGASLVGASLVGASLDGASLVGASLVGASLVGASLVGARLDGASLDGASLVGASLDGARLVGASLDGASLDGARLVGARLVGASLDGASLDGARLVGERPIFTVGPIGSRCDVFTAFITDKGLRLRAGCFFGTREEFVAKLDREHGNNKHGQEYRAALALMDLHVEAWASAAEKVDA